MKHRRRHSIVTLWKEYFFKTRPMLGPKPQRGDLAAMRTAKTILLEKRDNIGDLVLASSLLNEVYKRWEDRDVTFACTKTVAPLVQSLYPRWKIQICAPLGDWADPKALRAEVESWPAVDLMINLRSIRHQTEMIFSSWIPAAKKLGLGNQFEYEEGLYIKVRDDRVFSWVLKPETGPRDGVSRELWNYRILAGALYPDLNTADVWPSLDPAAADREEPSKVEASQDRRQDNTLLLVPFPSADVRIYPQEKLIEAVTTIAQRYDLKVGILGGSKDKEAGDELRRSLSAIKDVTNHCGAISLADLYGLIRRSRLVLGVETGPIHMAAACGVPTVAIIGGGHYGFFGPWGDPRKVRWLTHQMPCFGCNWQCSQELPFCIRNIESSELIRAADELLA